MTAYVPSDSPGGADLEREDSDKPVVVIAFSAVFMLGVAYSAVKRKF